MCFINLDYSKYGVIWEPNAVSVLADLQKWFLDSRKCGMMWNPEAIVAASLTVHMRFPKWSTVILFWNLLL